MTEIHKDQGEATPALPVDLVAQSRSAFAATILDGERRSYAWILAPVAAALLVAWGSTIPLATTRDFRQGLAVVAIYAGSAVLAVTPGVAVLGIVARLTRLGQATAIGLLLGGSGTTAMAGFWAWFVSPAFGRGIDVGVIVAAIAAIAIFGRRGDLRSFGLSGPLLLAAAIGLAFIGLGFVQGNGIGENAVRTMSTRYWRAADNAIPLLFATKLAAHLPLAGYLVGNWLSSDRPPLQTGFTLLQWPLWSSQAFQVQTAYQLLATGLSVSWLPALWIVFRVRGVASWRATAAVVATAFTGFMFVSALYVWPKMLAGTFALGALAIVVSRDEADRKKGTGVLVVALLTLSMLAHGGAAFAVIALAPFGWRRRRRITVKTVAACLGVLVALYVPWALYQRLVDPPGDRLLKWQIAGDSSVDPGSFLGALVQHYGQLSFTGLLANKRENLFSLVANPVMWHRPQQEPTWSSGFLGFARLAQVNDLLPAAGLLLLGALALLIPSSRRRLTELKPLVVFTAIALAGWVVLLWGGEAVTTINHQGAYAVTVLFIALCALAVTALPWPVMALILAGSLGWFAVSWIPGLGFTPAVRHLPPPGSAPWAPSVLAIHAAAQLNPAMLGVCVAGFFTMAAVLAWMYLPPRRRPQPSVFPAAPAPPATPVGPQLPHPETHPPGPTTHPLPLHPPPAGSTREHRRPQGCHPAAFSPTVTAP